jgi:pyruvyltransferase
MNGRKYLDDKNLVWWKPDRSFKNLYKQNYNVGDLLSTLLVERIVNYYGIAYEKANNPFLAIGSILHFAKSLDVVWGTGINGKIPVTQLEFSNLDVRAVRGPRTREVLDGLGIKCPEVYGDPGILTSMFFPVVNDINKRQSKIGYIPHMEEIITEIPAGVTLISPMLNLSEFIFEITSCSKIISSSLHGVIVAESYGIPAILLKNTSSETDFKYQDYYLGTGREDYSCINDINEAVEVTAEVYDLEDQKVKLLNAFPVDLWVKR